MKERISHLHKRFCALQKHTVLSAKHCHEYVISKNNSVNIWIFNDPRIWGTHLKRREVVGEMRVFCWIFLHVLKHIYSSLYNVVCSNGVSNWWLEFLRIKLKVMIYCFKAAQTIKADCVCVSVVYFAVRIYRAMKVRSIICLHFRHKETLWQLPLEQIFTQAYFNILSPNTAKYTA